MLPQDVAAHYSFPDATGKGQRIALIELAGGYHTSDLDACFSHLDRRPAVTEHSVEAPLRGLPLTGRNAPLDIKTIGAILDAFDEPGATFDGVAAAFRANEEFQVFAATLETTMDIAIAGSVANDAAIDVYFAPYSIEGLEAAIRAAVETKPTAISISWGMSESAWSAQHHDLERANAALAEARQADITVCCAAGDRGSLNERSLGDGLARVNFPASSPHALACGGTSFVWAGEKIAGEEVWNTSIFGAREASGGGESGVFPRPDYQSTLPDLPTAGIWRSGSVGQDFTGRLVPDVAGLADHAVGYSIVLGGRDFRGDGTSAVAPLWAALLARISELADRRVGWINERIYAGKGKGFRDVTSGSNQLPGAKAWFQAGPGWDACTGWGSPDGEELLELLTG